MSGNARRRVKGVAKRVRFVGDRLGEYVPNIGLERHEQKVLAQYLDLKGLLWCHVPNEGKRGVIAGVELKRQGLKAGVPDVLIFDRPPKRPDVRGVAIELKRMSKRAVPTAQQIGWMEELNRREWTCRWCCGANDAINWLHEMGW
jgi:hypothetical protein